MRHPSSSTRRVESTLIFISQQSKNNHSTALGIDQRLESIENASESRKLVQATKLDPPTISSLSRVCPEPRGTACMSRPSKGRFGHFFESSSFHETDATIVSEKKKIQAQSLRNPSAQKAVPASPFELSASFRPETYTVLDTAPILFSYHNRELDFTEYSRIYQCAMFFSKAP